MDVIHTPDNRILDIGTLCSHSAHPGACLGVRAQLQEQQQQEQQQVLPLQRSLEVGQS